MISLYKMPGPHNPGMFAKSRGPSSLSNVAQKAVCKRQRNLPASLQNLGQLRLVHAITGDQAPVIPREGDLATWPNTCRTKLPVKEILYSLKCLPHPFVMCVCINIKYIKHTLHHYIQFSIPSNISQSPPTCGLQCAMWGLKIFTAWALPQN